MADLLRSFEQKRILVGEGFATTATLHEAILEPAAVAFNAGNLRPVAEALHAKYPTAQIVICGDNDSATSGNPGLAKAWEAAQAVNGLLAAPLFTDPAEGTDFNDLAVRYRANEVRRQIAAAAPPAKQGPVHPEIANLLQLDALAYEQRREAVAKRLGIKPARLDKLVSDLRRHGSNIRTGSAQTLGAERLGTDRMGFEHPHCSNGGRTVYGRQEYYRGSC